MDENKDYGDYSVHAIKIKLTQTTYNENYTEIKSINSSESNITVYHISIPDCTPFVIAKEKLAGFMEIFHQKTLQKEGIVVHCQAGMGRTGQFILLHGLSDKRKFDEVFKSESIYNNAKNLGNYVSELRKSRPGLILVYEQLIQAVYDACDKHEFELELEKPLIITNSLDNIHIEQNVITSNNGEEDANNENNKRIMHFQGHGENLSNFFNENNNKRIKLLTTQVNPEGFSGQDNDTVNINKV